MTYTFVLVHGGFHGGWCWESVVARLESAGHRVTTPTLTGLGERRHLARSVTGPETGVQDIVNHLEMADMTDVVLVGHSLAGIIVSGVADRVPERIRQLIYLDSVLVEDGESWAAIVPAEVTAQRRELALTEGDGIFWPDMPLEALGIPADHPRAAWVRAHMTPLPFAYYEGVLSLEHPVGNGLPATYVVCTDPILSSLESSRRRAGRYGWPMREIATGHDAMVLAPTEVADLVLAEAEALGTEAVD
ncbi:MULTISPECIES: alpha/beta fold hydrolase [unclassified Aeromicrobium]|uniref:alpha/beta fold hydrolase n=1 Tax=unclassified Aeromicrobium TaxID=2633570 RepID=UPI00396B3B09